MAGKKIGSLDDLKHLTPAEINERWSEIKDVAKNPTKQTREIDPQLVKELERQKQLGYFLIDRVPKKQTFRDELSRMSADEINERWDEIKQRSMTENMDK